MTTLVKKIEIESKLFETISEIAKKENTTEQQLMGEMIKTALEIKRKNENKIQNIY